MHNSLLLSDVIVTCVLKVGMAALYFRLVVIYKDRSSSLDKKGLAKVTVELQANMNRIKKPYILQPPTNNLTFHYIVAMISKQTFKKHSYRFIKLFDSLP